MSIDIKQKYFEKIQKKRIEALDRGFLESNDSDYVPAKVNIDGNTYETKIRLKGDLTDHFDSEKWSFRVHVKNQNAIWGMRKFSIQDPYTRENLWNWAWLEHARQEGLMSPRSFFTNVILNGKNMGTYNFEEFFSKELIEFNNRREGLILKFDEKNHWDHHIEKNSNRYSGYSNAKIILRQMNNIKQNPSLITQAKTAKSLLEGFQSGQLPITDVFDVKLFAKYFAM